MDPRALLERHTEEVWNRGNLDAVEEFVAPEYVEHDPTVGESFSGPAAYRDNVEQFRTAFDELTVAIETAIVEDDMIAMRQRFSGRHTGRFMGIDPTGAEIDVASMVVCRIDDGKIAETWVQTDRLGLLRQLGVDLP